MIDEKKRVIEFVDAWTPGGVEKYIIQVIKSINKKNYDPIIWTTQKKTTLYDDEIRENGIQFISMKGVVADNPIIRIIQSLTSFKKDLIKAKCDIFHLHASNGVVLIYAYIAKKCGVSNVIVHSHSSDFGGGQRLIKEIGHKIGKYLFSGVADVNLACSDKAAEWLFPRRQIQNGKIEIVDYFVDIAKFKYNPEIRQKYRKKYRLEEEVVFLNIGRFHYQKNQLFLLELFKLISDEINAKLFLIGEGDLEKELKRKTEQLNLDNNVIFVGTTRNVERYMWMADIFLLPSLYEGNPITVTEAQAAGMSCFISNTITKRAKITDNTYFIDISSIDKCKSMICGKIDILTKCNDREQYNKDVEDAGYSIASQAMMLENMYSGSK